MRAFVVGNGPSLKQTPLHLLAGEVSFGVNNIHLIYPETSWRPTHYVRAEEAGPLDAKDWRDSIQTHMDMPVEIWCNDFFLRPRHGIQNIRPVNLIRSCSHYGRHYDSPDAPHLWHLPILCTFGSSVNVAIQIAHVAGYSPIYLVGCDLGYKDGEPNHFSAGYEHGKEQAARFANLDTHEAHVIASRMGLEIYNATIGGDLEVYPRVDFGSLFHD